MKKIFYLGILITFISLTGCKKSYNTLDDYVGEYIAYDADGNLLENGEPFLKIIKENDEFYYTLLNIKTTEEHKVNYVFSKDDIEQLKSVSKAFGADGKDKRSIALYAENGLSAHKMELYKVPKGFKFKNGDIISTNFYCILKGFTYNGEYKSNFDFFLEKIN